VERRDLLETFDKADEVRAIVTPLDKDMQMVRHEAEGQKAEAETASRLSQTLAAAAGQ
jgi:hypothetical protein